MAYTRPNVGTIQNQNGFVFRFPQNPPVGPGVTLALAYALWLYAKQVEDWREVGLPEGDDQRIFGFLHIHENPSKTPPGPCTEEDVQKALEIAKGALGVFEP